MLAHKRPVAVQFTIHRCCKKQAAPAEEAACAWHQGTSPSSLLTACPLPSPSSPPELRTDLSGEADSLPPLLACPGHGHPALPNKAAPAPLPPARRSLPCAGQCERRGSGAELIPAPAASSPPCAAGEAPSPAPCPAKGKRQRGERERGAGRGAGETQLGKGPKVRGSRAERRYRQHEFLIGEIPVLHPAPVRAVKLIL